MDYSKDIEVEMTFLPTECGGRKTAAKSGYYPQFYYDGHDWGARHNFIGTDIVYPGETVKAYLSFLSPKQYIGKLKESDIFLIREGINVVAYGKVIKIIELEKSAKREIEKELQNINKNK